MKNKYSVVHFVGIGGIGMSSLAQHLLHLGCEVSGSDRQENEQTQKLRKLGVKISVPHGADVGNAQLVVRTSAVPMDNVEVAYAMQHNIPVVLREQLLGEIFDSFPTRIAVCGTHGKTTVTAMLHHVLERCGVDHAAFIGGEFEGNNYFFGNNIVVAEACEYRSSFLHLHPTLCLCLNVEYDHPDCYKNLHEVEFAFQQLFKQSKKVVLSDADKGLCPTAAVFDGENIQAKNILHGNGVQFDLFVEGNFVCCTRLRVPCEHNIHNALAVIAVAKSLGLPLLQVAHALSSFCGVDRRWTVQQCAKNVVCDYAHHPTEIETTVKTAKSVCDGRVVCVFQPHTYSRTKAFWEGFVSCFDGVDEIVYLPIYPAREKPLRGVTSFQLCKLAKAQGKQAKYFATFQRTASYLKKHISANDLVVLVGAGDVNKLADLLKD